MISKILPYMRCPKCTGLNLVQDAGDLVCQGCSSRYPTRMGVLDMLGSGTKEVITPFQRLMQSPPIVSIYEKIWRRIGYYIASSRSFSKEMETVLQLADHADSDRGLDLACGPGVFTRPLAQRAKGVMVGLDLSWPMLRHAQAQMKKEGIRNILFVRASAFSMPFADHAFQYVNCCGALHLFDRPEVALKEVKRILDPGGFFSVQTTIRPERSAGIAYFLEKFIRFGFFDEEELAKLIRQHGFSLVQSERHRISFTFLARPAEKTQD